VLIILLKNLEKIVQYLVLNDALFREALDMKRMYPDEQIRKKRNAIIITEKWLPQI
jgi:hypothetical protein